MRTSLSLIVLLAMTWAHIVKPARGFDCHLTGVSEYSLVDHCHRSGEPSDPCHDEQDSHSGDETHQHDALIESLLALTSQTFIFYPDASTALCHWAADPFLSHETHRRPCIDKRRERRRWPHVLVHSISLRV